MADKISSGGRKFSSLLRRRSALPRFALAWLLIGLGSVARAQEARAPGAEVGQWERFESSIKNSKNYSDPYRDVELTVEYVRPDDSRVSFWGFYDGDQTWRIRFMPDRTGTWSYEARFSDGQPGARGKFRVGRSKSPGMIAQYEPNPIWFGYRGGKHQLIRSFHVGDRFFARNWDDPQSAVDGDKRKGFLDWAQAQGYNTLSVASHYLNRDVADRGKGWDTPDLYPLNAAEYRRLELMLDDLARRRMIVFPFAGFFGKEADFPRNEADRELYIKYTIARLGPYWNVLFSVGGPEPVLKSNPHLTADEVNQLGAMIRRHDVFGHLLTVHNPTGDDPYKDADWLTYGTLQGPKTLDPAVLSRGLLKNHHPAKPLYAQETLWPGNTFGHPRYTEEHVRKNAYVVMMSAAALNYADMNGSSSTGFSGSLDPSDRIQSRHDLIKNVWDFFETVPFYRMRPRQDVVDAGYCLAEEGREYLVYLANGGKVNVRVAPGTYAVEWIDARDTARRQRAGKTSGGALEPPAGGDDWLLRLTRSGK